MSPRVWTQPWATNPPLRVTKRRVGRKRDRFTLLGAADGYNSMMYPTIAELLDLVSRVQAEAAGEVITTGEQFLLDAAIFKLGALPRICGSGR